MIKKIILVFLFVMLILPINTALADEIPSVVDTSIPVNADIRAAVDGWLSVSAPAPYPYWAITYVNKQTESETFVSLVALDLPDPTNKTWHITDDDIVKWMGSIIVYANNSVELYSDGGYDDNAQASSAVKMAIPLSDGGGPNVRFPWNSGMSMMYGTRGVHAAGGGAAYAVGFSAVDFLGGADLGSGVASDQVYAVATGSVDYVCQDPTTTLIRTENTSTGDYYIYAHLLENSTLTEDYTFSQGALIGTLKHGSFDDNCGWAEQTAQHYHLHFGFKPSNGYFTMEGCVLDMDSEKWTCGTNEVSTGGFLRGGTGAPVPGDDDGGTIGATPSFWDLMVTGAVSMWSQFVVSNMPDHTTNQFLYALYNAISITVRIARVMVYSNINLGHFMAALFFSVAIKTVLGLAEFSAFILKAWKSLVPIAGA